GGVARPFAAFAQCRPDRDTEHEHEVQCDDDPVGCGELIHVPSPVSATSVGSRTAYVPGMPSTEYDAPRPAMAWPARAGSSCRRLPPGDRTVPRAWRSRAAHTQARR